MGRIDRERVERCAELAQLALGEEECEVIRAQLETILAYAASLEELDLTGVEATAHPLRLPTLLREDRAEAAMDPEGALANAPQRADWAFAVPKILDRDGGS